MAAGKRAAVLSACAGLKIKNEATGEFHHFDASLSLDRLGESVRERFGLDASSHVAFTYHDAEGDKMAVSSEWALRHAVDIFTPSGAADHLKMDAVVTAGPGGAAVCGGGSVPSRRASQVKFVSAGGRWYAP